jgi:hypothetical protein
MAVEVGPGGEQRLRAVLGRRRQLMAVRRATSFTRFCSSAAFGIHASD